MINNAMESDYKQKVFAKIFGAWKNYLPTLRAKRQFHAEIIQNYRLRVMRKVIKAFQLKSQYRQERGETDAIMTKAIQEIAQRKFFRYWRSLTGKRMGLLILEQTFEKLKLSSFFRRARRKSLFAQETKAHMDLYRDYLLLSKTFGALRQAQQRKTLDFAKVAAFKTIREHLAEKQFFFTWRQKYAQTVASRTIAFYAASHCEGVLTRRCYEALKANYVKGMQVRVVRLKHLETNRRRAFNALKKNALMQHVLSSMSENRDRATKQSFFNFWLLEMREKRMIKTLVLRRRFTLAIKAMQALRHNSRVQLQKKYLLGFGQAKSNQGLLKKVFFALSTHANARIQTRFAVQSIKELRIVNALRVSLRALY